MKEVVNWKNYPESKLCRTQHKETLWWKNDRLRDTDNANILLIGVLKQDERGRGRETQFYDIRNEKHNVSQTGKEIYSYSK